MASCKQQVYRKLMKEQKSRGTVGAEKVDHPLARYNGLGQLSCMVCNILVKSELLWTTHLLSKRHKQMVAALKSQKPLPGSGITTATTGEENKQFTSPNILKRKSLEDENILYPLSKKAKVFCADNEVLSEKEPLSGLPSDFFDQDCTLPIVDEGIDMLSTRKQSSDGQVSDVSGDQHQAKQSFNAKEALPEGFFDDPKLDAKVRNVEYKDPVAEQWEKFQKSIQREDEVSEALLFEGDEETKEEREMVEVNEQVACFIRAEELRLKQDQLMTRKTDLKKGGMVDKNFEVLSSSDELEFTEYLDWRAKIL